MASIASMVNNISASVLTAVAVKTHGHASQEQSHGHASQRQRQGNKTATIASIAANAKQIQ